MGAASDAYPSTSFMGMNPYSHPYYPYPTAQSTHHQNSAALSSAAAMDLMQSPTMFGQWKYGAGAMGWEFFKTQNFLRIIRRFRKIIKFLVKKRITEFFNFEMF